MIFFLYIKWSLNKTPLLCGVIDVPGVGVGLVFGVGWGGIPTAAAERIQVPGLLLIHRAFLEKLNHHPHLKNKRGAFDGREKEDVRINHFCRELLPSWMHPQSPWMR